MNSFPLGNTTEMVQPDQDVCNGGHIVHSDKLFVLSQENKNILRKQDVCDTRQTSNYIGGSYTHDIFTHQSKLLHA